MNPTNSQQYIPLQQGQAPAFGTSGAAVSALQQQLNQQNAGVAGYTPLTVDGMYGPLTQAASQFQAPNAGVDTSEPVGTAFQMPSLGNSYETDPNYIRSQQIITNNLNGIDNVDTNAIRSQTLADFQDRINAINSVYAGKLAEAQQQGKGRVGSTTSILANRGLAGSMRGGAIAEGTLTQNRQIEDAINAEKAAAIQGIYSQVNSQAQAEAERRRQAIEGGAKSYIDFIKGQETTKQTNLGNTVGAFIAQGIDPSTLTPDELKGIADKLKVSTSDIIAQYKQKEFESQSAQREQELKNNQPFELSEGQARFVYNPQTGKFDKVASVGKTYAPNSGGGNNGANGGIYDLLDYRTANAVIAQGNSFGTSDIVKKYNNIVGASNLIAGIDPNTTNPAEHQAIVYNFAKALDPDSVVREGEYATVKKYSQNLLSKYKGEIKQAIAGTGFLSPQAIKDIQAATDNRIKAYEPQYQNLRNQTKTRINSIAGKDVGDLVLLEYDQGYTGNNQTSSQSGTNVTPSGVTYTIEP